MARGGVNKALVHKARQALLARGEHPSIDSVRIEMGNTGSKTTIHRYLKELDQVDVSAPELNEELTELVARLAQRLQEQGQERIDNAQAVYVAAREKLEQELNAARQQITEQSQRLTALESDNATQAVALARCEQALHSTQTDNARLGQATQDLESRLTDKDKQIDSLEEKHQHARQALEHYRTSIKEQREQEQRRHEGQVQQLQMELRQVQQSLMIGQEDITRLNRDNERLLAENRATFRDLEALGEQLDKATHEVGVAAQQHRHAQTQCALLDERLRAATDENASLKQALTENQQQNRMLELLLVRKEMALEALQTPTTFSEPVKAPRPRKPKA
ncbi:DNA-binding protein [Pseudomonas sp. v388]|uniref:DNA-binding protein n=1 Tax=Pseudomonas sp. v388 TaxID=2479849 RepID=UPI000F774D0D|nr:DNA-binding protein [Pseudomonas sp. v388]RRV10765.1 DNA-binding protein [Pseudomonas sp. v388]